MRVAMVCNYPVDPKVVPGGVTAVAHYLVKGLGRIDELDLHVVCSQPDVTSDRVEERDGATVHFLSNADRFSLLTNHLEPRIRIARTIRKIAPDLVHAQGLGLSTAAAIDSKRPFVVALHGIVWKEGFIHLPTLVKRLRGRLRAARAWRQILATRNVFITSGYAASMLPPERGYREFVVNNPVSDEIFAIENRPEKPHVLVVGGTRQRKDPMTALRTIERVLREVPEATMHVVGPPSRTELDAEIDAFIERAGARDRVEVLGLVPEEVLWDEYRAASLLLLTSVEETAPVAIGEACAIGLPVVGTDAGGIPYMVRDGETGLVRPIGDDAALAAAVVSLLTDRAERDRLATNARALGLTDFSLDGIAAKTMDAYRTILDR